MSIFGNYARYYDLLYRDKDYVGEAEFVRRLLQTYAPAAVNILELGCGTGHHAALLAETGYQIHGIDLSDEMLARAAVRKSQLPPAIAAKLEFSQGDLRNVRLEQQFDAIVSLFHVISYQTTEQDLQAALATATAHLKPGGILIFDLWYGAAVLSDRPVVRVKRFEDNRIAVTRIAEPIIHDDRNLVDVNYHIFIKDKHQNAIQEVTETHQMRYLFKPEIESLLQQSGLRPIACREWMSDREIGLDTWSVYFVAGV